MTVRLVACGAARLHLVGQPCEGAAVPAGAGQEAGDWRGSAGGRAQRPQLLLAF